MNRILTKRVIPAATFENESDALRTCEALMAGGLDIVEITFRTAAAEAAIRAVAKELPGLLLGAGTVLTADQLNRALDAGIQFAVAPGLNPELVALAKSKHLAYIPGVATATEIDEGIRLGCKLLKFFPADALGGVKTLRAVAAPFSHTGVKFIPTGGINAANARDFLAIPEVAAVGGSWMVAGKLIKERNWAEITRLAREAVALATATAAPQH